MDIQMQYQDGLATARKIRESDEEVILIFITNFAQYAINGYSVGPPISSSSRSPICFQRRIKKRLGKLKRSAKRPFCCMARPVFSASS
jgi:CheY-like chemotaxis protein